MTKLEIMKLLKDFDDDDAIQFNTVTEHGSIQPIPIVSIEVDSVHRSCWRIVVVSPKKYHKIFCLAPYMLFDSGNRAPSDEEGRKMAVHGREIWLYNTSYYKSFGTKEELIQYIDNDKKFEEHGLTSKDIIWGTIPW